MEDVDDLVEDYLLYKSYNTALRNFRQDRYTVSSSTNDDEYSARERIDRILSAFSSGDYPTLLHLWDSIVVKNLHKRSPDVAVESNKVEFLINVHCGVFPFRVEVMQKAKHPNVAAKVAARAMTIFKHYITMRGRPLLSTGEFKIYKSLPKCGFPPTHPSFAHLFRTEEKWVSTIAKK